MPHLFDPFTIKSVTLRNRIGMPPMDQYSCVDGYANDWHLVHYGTRAAGGAGLAIIEVAAVEANARITPQDLGIWSDAHIEPLARVARFIKEQGCAPGIQIGHAGRKACTRRPWEGGKPIQPGDPDFWPVAGASPIAFSEGCQVPHELSLAEIQSVQASFANAAKRALDAGFEWLELHGAHGYLTHSFYSPLSNQRTDRYGGSFENRIRFFVETVRAVRTVWPEHLPFTARLSGTDWVEGGWTVDETVEMAKMLKAEGIDLLDCSSAGNHPAQKIPLGPGYMVPISEAVRKGAGIPTATVGLITSPTHADEIIRNGRADLVLLGRELLRDPYWPLRAAQALKQPGPVPAQYLRAF
jgi:2,4-dienoyl-CoA reductase-like NADH-dependent reductase (Old Yellow Enzyme family)